ncbi:MAG: rRNA maturation RNase YbeY [Candidatus Sungbacteria bacterium RIFCSPHIGHO2_02_FULL_52_23]|uniref:Endoribonuclease YbeY n=1 Tax=Candidatus Sungbacteria bacterium RIFCSPHIGHO2_02_FULL_52_23 TaxID=1802274 RepID=A0A1G2KY26_9BACT|nr:MAG: rRNA maturation RNase YbeY [Candidatus Sungbacteria bacterium RIFCSPHIGHO2_02_FULL_52_23]
MLLSIKHIVKKFPQAVRKKLPGEIAVVAVSEKESQALNRVYRKKNKAANVLSFWYSKEYGEIIVCPSLIRLHARAEGHTYQYQMTWMILHGTIHLSGLHHETSAGIARRIETLEQKILDSIFPHVPKDHYRP